MSKRLNLKIIIFFLATFIFSSKISYGEIIVDGTRIFSFETEFCSLLQNVEIESHRTPAFKVGGIQELSYEQRLALYNKEKKDRQTAMALGFILPGFGHYYANEPSRGAIFTLLEVVFIASAARAIQLQYGEEADFFGYMGSYGIAITHVVSGMDAGSAADRCNGRLRKKYNLTMKFFDKDGFQPKITLSYCF